MNYKTFTNEEELPKEKVISVVKAAEDEDGDILIGDYQDGSFLEEPNFLSLTDVTDPITNYLDESDEIYVHEEAEHSYNHAVGYSKIYENCGGNLEKIAEMLDEDIEIRSMEAENLD